MTFSILSLGGLLMLVRWIHFMAGITWIGLLYYFNFVQGSFFAETDAATKTNATAKLVPRAMWWFRWAAMVTFLAGFTYLGINNYDYHSSSGIAIAIGATLGTLMWFNVWFVIWPAQKIIIKSAQQVAGGGTALPEAAARAPRAGLASRTNTLFSIPMLFFMGATSHLGFKVNPAVNLMVPFGVIGALILLLELNVYKGKPGPMASVKGVIHCGIALAVVLYVLVELLTK